MEKPQSTFRQIAILAGLMVIVVSGLGAQSYQGPPNTEELVEGSPEDQKIESAMNIAQQIVDQLNSAATPPDTETGDGKAAKKNLEAFKKAKKDGRVCILKPPEIHKDNQYRASTWPDLPIDPDQDPSGTTASESSGNGSYKSGQTKIQWCGLHHARALNLCDCALAIVILHEGHRLEANRTAPGLVSMPLT